MVKIKDAVLCEWNRKDAVLCELNALRHRESKLGEEAISTEVQDRIGINISQLYGEVEPGAPVMSKSRLFPPSVDSSLLTPMKGMHYKF